jgi:hypothetical protein
MCNTISKYQAVFGNIELDLLIIHTRLNEKKRRPETLKEGMESREEDD